jgi:8-oxo-dGTP pyrophosphatase MutT (NUDIX family)
MKGLTAEKYSQNYPKRNVAVVGLRDRQGRILLVRTHKLAEWWHPVGGGMDPEDNSPEETVVRELKEEMGIILNPDELHLVMTAPYDFGEGTVHFFEALVDKEPLDMKLDTKEIIDYRWFSIKNSLELPTFAATTKFLQKLARDSPKSFA